MDMSRLLQAYTNGAKKSQLYSNIERLESDYPIYFQYCSGSNSMRRAALAMFKEDENQIKKLNKEIDSIPKPSGVLESLFYNAGRMMQ